jgi:flagellin-like protein
MNASLSGRRRGLHSRVGRYTRRRKGVSPIIATILLVAITVVLAAVLYVLITGLDHGPSTPSIGTALVVGSPVGGKCWAAGVTNHVCGTAGDQIWNFTIQSSSVSLGDALIEVHTASGAIYKNSLAAGFSVMLAGATTPVAYYTIAAGAGLAMNGDFTYNAGYSTSTKLVSTMFLVIGTGTPSSSWVSGQGNYVTIVGINHYSGATSPAVIP